MHTIESIRHNCIDRVVKLSQASTAIMQSLVTLSEVIPLIDNTDDKMGHARMLPMHSAAITVLTAHHDAVCAEIRERAHQAGVLFARDVIVPMARESGDEAVVFITSNSYMPPIRSFEEIEEMWNVTSGDDFLWEYLTEAIEGELNKQRVYMDCPEDDNCLYVVDLNRFEYNEDADYRNGDDINADWKKIA